MRVDTVTLILSGEVPLDTFANAIGRFSALVIGLSHDEGAEDVDWILSDLQVSSTVATVLGRGEPEKVVRVVRAYEAVGMALEQGRPIPYSNRVQAPARALRLIPGGRIESVTFETAVREAIIRPPERQLEAEGLAPSPAPHDRPSAAVARVPAYGAVEGRVQTLSSRGGLRFALYDLLHDKAVSCYLAEGKEEIMRGIWGHIATVEGLITRDPITGRPLAVRQITKVNQKLETEGSYKDARGAAPSLTGLRAEHAVRRLRDA